MAKSRPHWFEHFPRKKKETAWLPWPVCIRCGLLLLKNEASQRAAKQSCRGHEEGD